MDLRLTPYSSMPAMPSATGGVGGPSGLGRAGAGGGVQGATGSEGFGAALQGALRSVSAAQDTAAGMQREVQMENPAVSLEETMVAIQKAQIGFQATLHVRNRMVQAYTDIMNMQV
jgi:flagellar hook-basal body complex protein FliE